MVKRMAALAALVVGAAVVAGGDNRPPVFSSLFGDDGCTYKGTMYSHTSAVCQSGSQYRCDDGRWEGLGFACAENPLVAAKSCGYPRPIPRIESRQLARRGPLECAPRRLALMV